MPAQTFRKHQIVCKYTVLATIHFFFYEKPSPTSPGAKPSPSKSHWHRLPNWDIIFKFGTVEMLSSLLPLPLERQNIPDGFIIPCYPQNIQFLPPIVPDSEHTHLPATSGIVVIYLLVPPTPAQHPTHPRPPIRHPRHSNHPTPLIQRMKLVILPHPGILASTLFYWFFWVVGNYHYTCIK